MSLQAADGLVRRAPRVTCVGCGTRWNSARAPQLRDPGAVCPRCGCPLITLIYTGSRGGERGERARGLSRVT
jgi:hypothetical protein